MCVLIIVARSCARAVERLTPFSLFSWCAGGVHAPRVQRCVRAVHVHGVRAVLRAVPVRGGGAPVHARVPGLQGQRDGDPEPLLPADRLRELGLVRRVSESPGRAGGRCRRKFRFAEQAGGGGLEWWAPLHSPSRLLQFTGTLVLGVGDALVRSLFRRSIAFGGGH